jgi:two-component system OmpR family response regulator
MPLSDTTVLIVDDDRETVAFLKSFLEQSGGRVMTAETGADALDRAREGDFDVILLDIGLPDMSGITTLASLRQVDLTGIIMLSGHDDLDKRVICLELGADDFVAKPCQPRELVARIEAIRRRVKRLPLARQRPESSFAFAEFNLYPHRRELIDHRGEIVDMSSAEFSLLETFVRNPKKILTRDKLLALTYGDDISIAERAIDVHVNRIRRKIEADPKNPRLLKTIRLRGYLFTPTVVETGRQI